MPCYERLSLMERAVNSCLPYIKNHDVFNKIIVIDDSISKNIEDFCKNKSYIIYKRVINKNPGLNRNLAAKISGADYLLYLDSDNYLKKNIENHLYKIKNYLDTYNPDGIWISCNNKSNITSLKYVKKGFHLIKNKFYFNNKIGEVQHLVKRTLLINNPYIVLKGYTLDAPDYLWARVFSSKNNIYFFPSSIQDYQLNDDSISNIPIFKKSKPQAFNYLNSFFVLLNNKLWFNKSIFIYLFKGLIYKFISKIK